MSYTLIIVEKPDAARRISESIADRKPVHHENYGVSYYEFTVNGKPHICVPAVGHLFVLDVKKTENSKGWSYPVFDYGWVPTYTRKGTEWTEKYLKNIEKLAKGAADFIDAADVDNEGEVLLFNILRFLCGVEDAKRMKFSTLTKDELIESYKNIESHIMFPMLEAGLTRHELDWLYGINLTRALTLALKSASTGFNVLSTGRVQGPTLEILMQRELEIISFKPTPFWQLELHVKVDGEELVAAFEQDKIWEKDDADRIFSDCKGKDATVKDIKKKQYQQNPPVPFNTTDLQSEAYANFGFSPTQTLSIVEGLYQAGYVSYPRSSSQKLPPSIGYSKILKAIGKLAPYKKFVENILKKGDPRPVEGARSDPAHPAVYVTHETPDTGKLNPQQKKIYDLIARRTLATFAEAAVRETNTVALDVNGNRFLLVGKKTLEPGWTEIYAPYLSRDEIILPDLKIGQALKVDRLDMLSKETQPPGRYSQGSILKELEKRDLGTKATRADILQTLYDRGYVTGKSINVTKLGEAVVRTLEEYSPKIVSEELTRHFEDEMELVYKSGKKREDIVDEAKTVLAEILEDFRKNEKEIGKKLLEGFTEAKKEASRLGICPKCGNELRIMRSKTGGQFVGCDGYPKCTNLYPLPRIAKIQSIGRTCKECGTPMIQVIRRARRPFRMCIDPNCTTKASWGKKK
ncbi:MAG: DNA topoisomerase I [Candidatus Aenigmarchaeota archaeon]|nr:DNA topoisomerase I [Candidatus Aenigmarchaeota archaeon]